MIVFKIVGSLFSWLLGSLLFLFISVKIFVSFIADTFKKILNIRDTKPVSEKAYLGLASLPIEKEEIIFSAELPTIEQQVEVYDLEAILARMAREILISVRLKTGATSKSVECGYSLYGNHPDQETVSFFLFANPFQENTSLDYSQIQFWYTLPPKKKFYVQLTDSYPFQFESQLQVELNVVAWR